MGFSLSPAVAAVLSPTLLCAGAAILLYAAFHDIVARTVPNGVCALLALVGLVARTVAGDWLFGIGSAAIVFVICLLFWLRGWMGGGDVKLIGAAALVVPAGSVFSFVLATTIAGAVLAMAYLLGGFAARKAYSSRVAATTRPTGLILRGIRVELRRLRRGGPLPYACAIAAGYLLVVHLPL
jgi:prepilin peptidase CpaA